MPRMPRTPRTLPGFLFQRVFTLGFRGLRAYSRAFRLHIATNSPSPTWSHPLHPPQTRWLPSLRPSQRYCPYPFRGLWQGRGRSELIRSTVVRRRSNRRRRRYRAIPPGLRRCSEDVRCAISVLYSHPSLILRRHPADILGSTAFATVKSDLNGNIEKIRTRLTAHPVDSKTLEGMLEAEAKEGVHQATQALLWLLRGLQFTMIALQLNQADSTQELQASFSKAYDTTLKQFHNFIVKKLFAVSTSYFSPCARAVNAARQRVPVPCSHTHCPGINWDMNYWY